MTVTILPVPSEEGKFSFCAVSGGKSSPGRTPGEALDAISAQLSDEQDGTLVVVQSFRPDRYFTMTRLITGFLKFGVQVFSARFAVFFRVTLPHDDVAVLRGELA